MRGLLDAVLAVASSIRLGVCRLLVSDISICPWYRGAARAFREGSYLPRRQSPRGWLLHGIAAGGDSVGDRERDRRLAVEIVFRGAKESNSIAVDLIEMNVLKEKEIFVFGPSPSLLLIKHSLRRRVIADCH